MMIPLPQPTPLAWLLILLWAWALFAPYHPEREKPADKPKLKINVYR